MTANRRQALRFLRGSAIALAALGGGAGAFFMTRTPGRALAPWQAAASGAFQDPRMQALAYAVLAPNPHNRQPWLLELVGDNSVRIYCELDRRLPETDPFDRQITIGFGAFIELLRIAASEQGYGLDVNAFPDGEPTTRLDARPIAEVRFQAGAANTDPLFAHILNRHTNRDAYEARPPEAAHRQVLQAAIPQAIGYRYLAGSDDVDALRQLTWRSFERELTTADAYQESIDLMRIGKAEINANPDGLVLDGGMMELLNMAGLVTRETLADPQSQAFQQGLDMYEAILTSGTSAYVMLTSEGNSRIDQLDAGRDWIRLHLAATSTGLAMQPLSQALQEYPEQAEFYQRVHDGWAQPGQTIQMLGRVGYGPSIGPSPRWPVESRIRAG